jgi:hypothetical protein
MTIAKPKMFSLPTPSVVMGLARTFFTAPDTQVPSVPMSKPQPAGPDIHPFHQDRSRYARLLERELDRQVLTEVEREDTDMLNRVRSAMYAD